MKDQWRPTND